MAERIQRRRTKGWRMPEGAVYVGRPSRWGNSYTVAFAKKVMSRNDDETQSQYETAMRRWCVDAYRDLCVPTLLADLWKLVEPLRGRDLACWCPLDRPCHADVLLELANG